MADSKNKYNFRFFQNKSCEFFPCHKIAKQEDFNCLFCFCPIYALKDKCGGDYEYLENGVKDCSNCVLPHLKENYQLIVDRVSVLVDKVKINDSKYVINEVLLATSNQDKIKEFKHLFTNIPILIKTLKDFNEVPKPVENGKTFKENALIKAKYYSRKFNMACIADDSGLVVNGLDGFPGIHSNRWLEGKDYSIKNDELVKLVNKKTPKKRQAKYICVLSFYDTKINFEKVFFGEWRGHIAKNSKGKKGFGYDPIFIVDKYQKTAAEISLSEKSKYSHRGSAALGFLAWMSFFIEAD